MEGMKTTIKSMIWNTREKKSNQSEQQEEKRIKKKTRILVRSLWDISKCTNIQITGVPEGEEEEQEIENLFEKT